MGDTLSVLRQVICEYVLMVYMDSDRGRFTMQTQVPRLGQALSAPQCNPVHRFTASGRYTDGILGICRHDLVSRRFLPSGRRFWNLRKRKARRRLCVNPALPLPSSVAFGPPVGNVNVLPVCVSVSVSVCASVPATICHEKSDT